jgi:hypothetical protein
MKIIFVNWTKPFFHKNQFNGYKKNYTSFSDEEESYHLEDYEILMQLTTISCAKKNTNLPLKLYTDTIGYEYYKKINILKYFDEIDVDVLNSVNEDTINPAQFWTSGKIISICKEEPPFIFMDLDLFLLSKIPSWLYENDVVCTHWELPRNFLYVTNHMIEHMGLDIPEFDETMLTPNTSFLFINNKEVQKRYLELHYQIVRKQYDNVPDWLWLMSDQNILGYVARNMKINISQIDNRVYLQFPDPHNKKDLVGSTPAWTHFDNMVKNTPILEYEHIWLDKSQLFMNPYYKKSTMEKWTNLIISNGHESYIKRSKLI